MRDSVRAPEEARDAPEMSINCAGCQCVHAGKAMCDSVRAPEEARDAPRDDHKLRGDVHGPALDCPGTAQRAAGDHLRGQVPAYVYTSVLHLSINYSIAKLLHKVDCRTCIHTAL